MPSLNTIFLSTLLLGLFSLTYWYAVARKTGNQKHYPSKTKKGHMVIVLGSGGHSAEMISILRDTDPRKYAHRTYIISSGENYSAERAFDLEHRIQAAKNPRREQAPSTPGEIDPLTGTWEIKVVSRARRIHQPFITAPISCLICLYDCLKTLYLISSTSTITPSRYPDAIINNGPGTGVIVTIASTILRFLLIAPYSSMKIIYIESWARVETLSLSGKILFRLRLCHLFFVQWERLQRKLGYPATYVGALVEIGNRGQTGEETRSPLGQL